MLYNKIESFFNDLRIFGLFIQVQVILQIIFLDLTFNYPLSGCFKLLEIFIFLWVGAKDIN
jgi:hypothetical protein